MNKKVIGVGVVLIVGFWFLVKSPSSNVDVESLQFGDSLFSTKSFNFSLYERVHYTNSGAFKDGHAQVDSNKIRSIYVSANVKEFLFAREESFLGQYLEPFVYDKKYVRVDLSPALKTIFKGASKVQLNKKDFYSGKIRKGVVLENFPNEFYLCTSDISVFNCDSIFEKMH